MLDRLRQERNTYRKSKHYKLYRMQADELAMGITNCLKNLESAFEQLESLYQKEVQYKNREVRDKMAGRNMLGPPLG